MKPNTWKTFRWIVTWAIAGALGYAVATVIVTKTWSDIPTVIFCVGCFILLLMLNSWMDEWE